MPSTMTMAMMVAASRNSPAPLRRRGPDEDEHHRILELRDGDGNRAATRRLGKDVCAVAREPCRGFGRCQPVARVGFQLRNHAIRR
jgi:hypothetical protein